MCQDPIKIPVTKVKMFDDLEYLVALKPYQMKRSQYNDIDRVWETSRYHPKLSMSIFKVTRSRKGQTKNFRFGWSDICFWVSFSRTQKLTLEHFLNGPNRKKSENRENTEIAGNSVKNSRFQPSKQQNSVIFQDIYLKFCINICAPDRALSHIFRFFLKYSPIF